MKSLTIRNIPDDLYHTIHRIAARNRRSMQQQLLFMLDRMRVLNTDPPVEKATAIRKRLAGRALGNTLDELHEDRAR